MRLQYANGEWKTKSHHRIVAEVWLRKPNSSVEVDHIDNDRSNNCVSNLRWVSKSTNNKKSWACGNRNSSGENNGRSKLTQSQVHLICLLLSLGESLSKIARRFEVSKGTISAIKQKRNWKHISSIYL